MMRRINKSMQIILCATLLFSAVPSQAMGRQSIAGSIYKSVTNCSAMLFNAIKDHPKIAFTCAAGAGVALSYGLYRLAKVKFLNPKLISAATKGDAKTVR